MKDYDIALGGVASDRNYLDVSNCGWSFILYKELPYFWTFDVLQMG